MPKLRTLAPLVRPIDTRTVPILGKQKDPLCDTKAFRDWRAAVLKHANFRCEAIINGHRCTKAVPFHHLVADHVVELRDGGQAFDVNNGQALCRACHVRKTSLARAKRLK
jgi:5-methylcytosine-specific restriction enzyme A